MTSPADEAIEVRGRTIETAIEKGLEELGLSRSAVEIEVVNPGSRGVLGIGAEDAVVRLTPRPRSPVVRAPSGVPPAAPSGAPPVAQATTEEPAAEAESTRSQEPAGAVAISPSDAAGQPSAEVQTEAEVAALAENLLSELLRHLGVEAQVETRYDDPEEGGEPVLLLDVVGKDLGILIGRRGETLASLQFLLRLMVNNHTRRWMNLVVDVEGYKARRESMLRELAQRMAERAVTTGRVVALEAMPARERRIVHLALRDHPDVSTQSIGEGDARKVTIIPR
jgi:spoIIIJ-associated protein